MEEGFLKVTLGCDLGAGWVEGKFRLTDISAYLALQSGLRQATIEARIMQAAGLCQRPPKELSLIVGDCLHNLRSSLDHLVYEIARADKVNKGVRFSKSIAQDSGFPIFSSPEGFEGKTGRKMTRGIPFEARKVIERHQPYREHPHLDNRRLGYLHELAKIDRHRFPPLALFSHTGTRLDGENAMVVTQTNYGAGIIEDGAQLARYTATPIKPNGEMKVKFKPSFDIAFAEAPCKGEVVGIMLWWFHYHIQQEIGPQLHSFLE